MTKIRILLVTIVACLTTSCSHKQYHNDFMLAYLAMGTAFGGPESVTAVYMDSWNDLGVEKTRDKLLPKSGLLESLAESEALIGPAMEKIKNPPRAYQKAYDKLVEMYGLFKTMDSEAHTPTGTLEQYSNTCRDTRNRFHALEAEVKLLMPSE